MISQVFVFDPTAGDALSRVRGVGRYLQILKENFHNDWNFVSKIENCSHSEALAKGWKLKIGNSVFINPFFNFLTPPLAMRRVAEKQIAVIHDLIPLKYSEHFPIGLKGKLNVFLNKLALKNYDLIVTDSEVSKKDIIDILRIEENKIKIIYPCLPQSFTENQNSKVTSSFPRRRESRLKLPHKDVIIDWIPSYEGMTSFNFCLYVGDATWNKNLVNLAKAIKLANVTCVFVGKVFEEMKIMGVEEPGIPTRAHPPIRRGALAGKVPRQAPLLRHVWQKELKEFFVETDDDKRFLFAGFIPDNHLINFYKHSAVNILVSRDEGFGFSYLEAATFGCPSILSAIPVLKEISDNQALFVNGREPSDIAKKINQLFNDKNLRNQLGSKAQERAKYFNRSKFKSDFMSLIY